LHTQQFAVVHERNISSTSLMNQLVQAVMLPKHETSEH